MKKKQLFKDVATYVKEVGVDAINKDDLAQQLMSAGASFALVGREMPKALRDNGVETSVRAPKESLEALEADIKESFEKGMVLNNFRELREAQETFADDHVDINDKAVLACIKSYMKENGMEIPQKLKLGAVNEAIVQYFSDEKDHSLKGLASYLESNTDCDEDKALHYARMKFTFAYLLWNNTDLSAVN